MNKVILIGNVGRDPEVKHLNNGGKVCNFSLATSESFKNKQGEKVEQTEWHNIVVWDENLVGIIERFVSKGSRLSIVGKNKTRSWDDQDGGKRYVTEVVLDKFKGELYLLGDRGQSQTEQDISNFEKSSPVAQEEGDELPF